MFARFTVLSLLFTGAFAATAVKKCSGNKPFPLEVRVYGCEIPPCIVIKGTIMEFDIDFVSYSYSSEITAMVKATTLGITIPYELPENVRNVCKNLMYGAYCPLYPEEDVTYKFLFHIGNYPETSVKVEIYLVNQVKDIITCFVCDIKVRKGLRFCAVSYSNDLFGPLMELFNKLKDPGMATLEEKFYYLKLHLQARTHFPATKFSPASFYAKTTSFQCFTNLEMIANASCKLKPVNWELTYATIEADLLVTLRNVTVRLETFKYTNQFRPFLINVTFNACEAMKFRNMHSYAKIITNIFLKYSNLNHTCPFSGHVIVERSYFDSDLIPFNIPSGDYKLITSMYEGWPLVRFGRIHYAFTIKERKKNTRKRTKNIF